MVDFRYLKKPDGIELQYRVGKYAGERDGGDWVGTDWLTVPTVEVMDDGSLTGGGA